MLIYELATIIAIIAATGSIAAFLAVRSRYYEAITELRQQSALLSEKVAAFDAITKKASESNESLGTMCKVLDDKVIAMDERISMIQTATFNQGAGTPSWVRSQKPPGQS